MIHPVTAIDPGAKCAGACVSVTLAACLLTGCNFDSTPIVPGQPPATLKQIHADAYETYKENPPHDHTELDAWSRWRAEIETRTTWRDQLNGQEVKDWSKAHPQFIEADKVSRARQAYNRRTDKLRPHDEGAEAKKAVKAQEQGLPDAAWALRHPAQVRWYDEHHAADPGPVSDDPPPAASDPEREERRQALEQIEKELKDQHPKRNQDHLKGLLAKAAGKERDLINVRHRDKDAYRNLNCMARPRTDFPEHTISEAILVLKREAAFQAHRCLQLSNALDQDERDQKAWERLRKMVQTEIDKAEGSKSAASLQSLQEQCCDPPRAAAVRELRGPPAMAFAPSRTVRGPAAASKGSQARPPALPPALLPPPILPVAPLPQRTATHRPALLPPLMPPPALPGAPVGL